ncbi:MAG: hypothetical protein ACJAYU_003736 [Bradymonadia bacterium]|jgi:hypothetical protein
MESCEQTPDLSPFVVTLLGAGALAFSGTTV